MSVLTCPKTLSLWDTSAQYQDTVLFSRVTLRRNHSSLPFKDNMTDQHRSMLMTTAAQAVAQSEPSGQLYAVPDLDKTDIALLEDNESIAQGESPDAVVLFGGMHTTLALNGFSHYAISSVSGGAVSDVLERCLALDRTLNASIPYAFHDSFGYLFSDPSRCGTGAELSSVLHIPSISTLKCYPEIKKICDDFGFGLSEYPEGFDQEIPCFCRISSVNDRTRSESDSAMRLHSAISMIAELERDAREEYYYEFKPHVDDAVWRSFGILANSRMIGYREAFEYLSHIRLGVILSIIRGFSLPELNELFFKIRRARVTVEAGLINSQLDTDQARATVLRSFFSRSIQCTI
jgi:protein arginine kinase